MRIYIRQEKIDLILLIWYCEENSLLAYTVYTKKYTENEHTGKCSLEPFNLHLLEMNKMIFLLWGSLVENPYTNDGKLNFYTGISRRIVQRIVKKYKFHPYNMQLHRKTVRN